MPELNIWNILTTIAILSLFIEFRMGRKAAAWGALIVGVLIGMVWVMIFVFIGEGWQWRFLLHGIVISVLLGVIIQILVRHDEE